MFEIQELNTVQPREESRSRPVKVDSRVHHGRCMKFH